MGKREFLAFAGPAARKVEEKTGLSWKALIAVSALETGWGRFVCKEDGKDSRNLFNIKGKGPAGSVSVYTREWYTQQKWDDLKKKGVRFELTGRESRNSRGKIIEGLLYDDFRAYNTYEESFDDFVRLVQTRYPQAWVVRHDPLLFVQKLAQGGYATDPAYADKLSAIIRNL
ncbi:MAG: peptidoglycan hydrolase FlgJ [Bacillota bacterium]|nr:peptidoglycan hydrolase FlgJ [Bacillota bacterium]